LNEFPRECGCNLKKLNDVYLERSSELFAEEYKDFTLKSFIAKEQFQKYMLLAANNFLTKTGVFSILFLGQSGVGKSHICIAIANELIKKGAYVEFMPYVEFMIRLKQNMTDSEVFNKMTAKFRNCNYLVIDDFLKNSKRNGRTNETDLGVMFDILDFRYRKKRPVILSSEYYLHEIALMDEALAGRLKQMATHDDSKYIVEIAKDKSKNYRMIGGGGESECNTGGI
jgi:DNA replication protein DnaC